MKKRQKVYFTLLLMLAFQNVVAQTTSKSLNKGNIKIDVSFTQLMTKGLSNNYPDIRVGASCGLTDWCMAGVFGSIGIHNYYLSISDGTLVDETIVFMEPDAFDGKVTESYFHYGANVELHPLAIWFPNYYFIDLYGRGEIGVRTVVEHYDPSYDGPITEPVRNNFLYGGSVGIAINPTKCFGLFYECALDNLNKFVIYNEDGTEELKTKPIHRFGLNARFPRPKKLRKE